MTDPQTPDWVRDAIFYQIFPDRFARSLTVAKPGTLDGGSAADFGIAAIKGATRRRIRTVRLPRGAGVNAILSTLIFQSA